MVEPFEALPPPPEAPPELAAVRAPELLALALPEPDLPVGPLASAPDEQLVVVVVEEVADPPAAFVVGVVDFAVPAGGLVVVVADEHPALPAPRAWAPEPPAPLEPVTPPEPCTIGLCAAASIADWESRLPHPAKRSATLASASAVTADRCLSGRT
jgi:hypothetical protein